MPATLAYTLLTIAAIAALVFILVLSHSIWVWSRPKRQRYALQSPIYKRDKPNPQQWLLDIAQGQRDNPLTHLVITDRIWFHINRDAKRPYLTLRIFYRNLGIFDLLVEHPEGYASYKSEKLPDYIRASRGKNNVPAGRDGSFDLEVFIPDKFLTDVCTELDSITGELRGLGLEHMMAGVYIKGEEQLFQWYFGESRTIFRPNR